MSMRRRDFIIGVAGAATWPRATRAQQAERTRRIGVLLLFAASDPEGQVRVRAFRQGLQAHGWKEGHNVHIEYRFASGDFDQMRAFAKELIELQADVIVTNAISPIMAVWPQTSPIPIVLAMAWNPVQIGFIKSLSHPDHNITGFPAFEESIIGKWLELLKAIAPGVTRVGMMFSLGVTDTNFPPLGAYWLHWLRQLEAGAASFAVEPVAVPVHDLTEMQDALAALGRNPGGGLLMVPDPLTVGHYREVVALALQHRLPGCYPYRYFATEGGLMSYGPNGAHVFRQAASYVDLILKGAKPSDLPIQRPTKFDLMINLKTAKALGLRVPPKLLALADEVIE